MVRLVTEGTVETIDGKTLTLEADTICVHSDTPVAVALAEAIVRRFDDAGIVIRHFGDRQRTPT